MYVFVKYSNDEYRTIEIMADTIADMSRATGRSKSNVCQSVYGKSKFYEKIWIDYEPEEESDDII